MRRSEVSYQLAHVSQDLVYFKLRRKVEVRLEYLGSGNRDQFAILSFIEGQPDQREWLQSGAEPALHPAGAFRHGPHQAGTAGKANGYAIGFSQIVGPQHDRICIDQPHGRPPFPLDLKTFL